MLFSSSGLGAASGDTPSMLLIGGRACNESRFHAGKQRCN
jgi:hypothetical protein